MSGGRNIFASLSILLVSVLVGCGDRNEGSDRVAAAGDTARADTAAAAIPDTAATVAASAGGRDTAAAAPRAPEPAAQKPPAPAARATPSAPAPATKPADSAPAPKPSAPAPAASRPTASPPADSDTASSAPAAAETAAVDTPPAAAPQQANEPAPASTQATAPLRDEYHRAPLDTVSQQVYNGWKQYNLNCARCHGEDVLGSTIAPHLVASLKPDGPINTKELFIQTVCAGRPEKGMPAWCPLGLEMDKIEAMYAYVKGRSEGKIRPGRPAVNPEG